MRKRPGSPEPTAGFFQPFELDAGLVQVADRDQRLDGKLAGRIEARLARATCLPPANDRSKRFSRRRIVAGR